MLVVLQASFLQLECGGALARLLAAIASPDATAAHALANRADEAQVLPGPRFPPDSLVFPFCCWSEVDT